jgi:outer membrane protein assembly factor BamB
VVYDDAGRLVVAVANDAGVEAVDAHTGELIWRAAADQSEFFQVPVVSADRELLVPDHWGRLAAFDPHDGHRLWEVRGPDAVAEFGEPVLVGPRFAALSLDEGGPRLASPAGVTAISPPNAGHGVARLADGGLVVTTWDGPVNFVVVYDVRAPTS